MISKPDLSGLSEVLGKLKPGDLQEFLRKGLLYLLVLLLVTLMTATYVAKRIVYQILPGEAGVRWSLFEGTEIDKVYGEGIHFIQPWDKLYVYNVRIQELKPDITVLTKTGLKVHLFLSIRYAPQYSVLTLLHQKIGPDYPNVIIVPEIESVLREIIGTMEAEQIYTTGREVIVQAINRAIEQVAQRYIVVDDVLIRRIELPDSVAEAIRFKIKEKHLVEAKAFSVLKEVKESERKRIEGMGTRDRLRIIAEALPEGQILKWQGIQATQELAKSNNAKIVVIGGGKNGLPLILNTESSGNTNASAVVPPTVTTPRP